MGIIAQIGVSVAAENPRTAAATITANQYAFKPLGRTAAPIP